MLIYGGGGHKTQMQNLFRVIEPMENIQYVGFCDDEDEIKGIINFRCMPLRNKYSIITTFIAIPFVLFLNAKNLFKIIKRFRVIGVVGTGSGVVIIPSLFFKVLSVPIVFIETWSRFETKSLTGKVMYRVSDKFYVQSKELLKHYPKAVYSGML